MSNTTWTRFRLWTLAIALLSGSLVLAQGAPAGETPAGAPKEEEATPQSPLKTIFDYKDQLNLTDQQIADIKKLLGELARTLKLTQAKLTVLAFEVDELIKGEGDLGTIRAKLDEEAKMRSEARYADVLCSRNINKVLSESQLAAWKRIQEEARAKAAVGDSNGK